MSGRPPASEAAHRIPLATAWHLALKRFRDQRRSPREENSASDTVVESFRLSKKFSRFQNITRSVSSCAGGKSVSRQASKKDPMPQM